MIVERKPYERPESVLVDILAANVMCQSPASSTERETLSEDPWYEL